MNYVTLAVPFFILLMLVEVIYGWLRKHQTYRLNDSINSLQMGTLSTLKKVLQLSFSAAVLGGLVQYFGISQRSTESPWLWVLAFIAYDFCYYWKHRYGHQWRIMWAAHAAHHQSEEYNLSTALRQTSTDYIGFVFYIPMYLAGVPVDVIITVGSLNLIYQFWVHTEHIRRLGWFEYIMVTPSNHRVHHARNPNYIDKNYGGVFIIWDRMFGTFKDESKQEPCVYGITQGLASWNPLWANAHVWYETLQISLKTSNWFDKIKIWFKGPGWYPDDIEQKKIVEWQYAKFDPSISNGVRYYVFSQFWMILPASLTLTKAGVGLPREIILFGFIWICLSFYNQGLWIEGRRRAQAVDWLRLAMLSVFLWLASTYWPVIFNAYGFYLAAYVCLTIICLVSARWWREDIQAPVGA